MQSNIPIALEWMNVPLGDFDDILWLLQEAYPEEKWDRDSLIAFQGYVGVGGTKHNTVRIARDENRRAVGVLLYSVIKNKHRIIRRLIVDPAMRRQGIGTKIIDLAFNRTGPQPNPLVYAHVPEGDLGTQLFFKKLGFVVDPKQERRFHVIRKEQLYPFQRNYPTAITPDSVTPGLRKSRARKP